MIPNCEVKIVYKNWRGEVAERTVLPRHIWFGSTKWHVNPQWLLNALDLNKGEDRDFALAEISSWTRSVDGKL